MNEVEIIIRGTDQFTPASDRVKSSLRSLGEETSRTTEATRQLGQEGARARDHLGRFVSSSDSAKRSTRGLGDEVEGTRGRFSGLRGVLSDIHGGLTDAGITVNGVGEQFKYAGSKVMDFGSKVLSVTAMAGTALLAAAGAAATMGIRVAAANETAGVSFELLLGGAQQAKTFLADLQKFAAATPFDMPSLRDAASRLLAVGVRAQDVIPLMTRLGDATAAMGTGSEGIQRAVLALQQVRTAGVVMGGDLLQLTEAGIPALDALAAHFGKSVADIKKMAEKGQIKPDDLFGALLAGEGPALQRVKGMMDKQSATLQGVWSTFKDNLGQTLASAFDPLIPGMKKGLNWAAEEIPKALDGLRSSFKRFSDIFKDSTVGAYLLGALEKAGKEILPFLRREFDKLVKTVQDNKEGLEKFGRWIADVLVPILERILVGAIAVVVATIQGVIWAVAHFTDAWNSSVHAVVTVLKFLAGGAIEVFGIILHAAVTAFGWVPGLGDKLRGAEADFRHFAATVMDQLDRLDGKSVNTYINTVYRAPGSQYVDAAGNYHSTNIKMMATGGMSPGGLTIVGERGRELLELPAGTRVHPNDETENILRSSNAAGVGGAGIGGPSGVVLEIRSSGSGIDDLLVELLRRAIRVRGGNVQVALGKAGR